MKILHLIFSEQIAGAEKSLLDLLPGLKAEGIDCDLICVCPPKEKNKFTWFCNELNDRGVKTVMITGTKYNFLAIARRIDLYLRSNKINYLHSHLFKSDVLAVMVKKFFNKKVILISTKHGYQEKYLSGYPVHKGRIFYNAYYFISKYLVRNINKHLTVSRVMSNIYYDLKLTPVRMKYIYHGINIAPISPTFSSGEFKGTAPQLAIVGRIEEVKGHRYLFEAMNEIVKVFPGVQLFVIGNGTQKERLMGQSIKAGMEKNILFLGFQQDPYPYISQSDVMVLPSLFESFGLVYIEALALQVPIVAFDAPACNEIITNNETGLLAPVFDSVSLAKKIIYLLQNREERKRLSDNGYKKYTNYFNTTRVVQETAAWYRSELAGN